LKPAVTIVGAGIAGAAAAWRLTRHGFHVRVFERSNVVGGHIRTEWMNGVPYEPNGAHVFHTHDEDVWRLVSKLTDFVPYRHRVVIRVRGHLLSWPIQTRELSALSDFDDITEQLKRRPKVPDNTNFETYCVSLLGTVLYNECVREYTRKQWGRDPHTLSAAVAAGRVELRNDGYGDLFRDPFQGWPRHGYAALIEAMLDSAEVHLGEVVTIDDLPSVTQSGDPVVVTSALDDFLREPGALPWRGVRLQPQFQPSVTLAQPAMVINEPSPSVAWTRTIETKWAIDELHERAGTIVMREFPGASAKHYPVADVGGGSRAIQSELEHRLHEYRRNPLYTAGRLATYRYINMDAAVRDGLDAASQIMKAR
jgi:UDP-galactopyranose mutase